MKCRVCAGPLQPLLILENMPSVAQHLPRLHNLGADKGITLHITQCEGCALVQLANEPVAYWRETIYTESQELREFRIAQLAALKHSHGLRSVIELGSDPQASTVQYDAFLLLRSLEHVPAPNALLATARNHLRDGGMGIVDVPNFDMILKHNMVAEFMLDHLMYFTATTLRRTLSINGFDVLEVRPVWHDYILSATVRKRPMLDISRMAMNGHGKVLDFIAGKSAAIWGAGHQALATMSLLKLDANKVKYVVDSSPAKQGRYTPVTHIPIVPPQTLADHPVEALVIMCGSYSEEVAKQAEKYAIQKVLVA